MAAVVEEVEPEEEEEEEEPMEVEVEVEEPGWPYREQTTLFFV